MPSGHLQTNKSRTGMSAPQPGKTMLITRNLGGLLTAGLLIGTHLSAIGGEMTALSHPDKNPVSASKPVNPLCFFDGSLCFDVQERLRFEVRNNNFDFNDSINDRTDDAWLLQRFRFGMLVQPVKWLKLYAQGQDSREFESDRPNIPGTLGAEGDDNFDLRQGYVEFSNYKEFPLGIKIGRQILSYGDERLIGSFDWNNIGRTFDAVKVRFEQPRFAIDAFVSSVVRIQRDEFNKSDVFNGTEAQREELFAGVYASTTAVPAHTFDLYGLYLHDNNDRFPELSNADTNFGTIGTRIKADPLKLRGWEYEGEFAFQAGEVRAMDLIAFALHAGAGYNFLSVWSKPRIFVEYNFATGDDDALDAELQTFQNLFPTNHKFYGYMDLFSWQNMHNPALSLRCTPVKNVTVQADGHAFWLATNEDAWYRANGTATVRPLTPIARSASTWAGAEVDLTVTYTPCKNLAIQAGYSHFFAGDYLGDTGAQDGADFGYLMATLSF
jgi:hypothetical protein